MNRLKHVVIVAAMIVFGMNAGSKSASAQSTEDRFHDVFITAGYSTAFGAALGAALLSFSPDPASQLRYVAIGASLGFIGGSILGAYTVFSPLLAATDEPVGNTLVADNATASPGDIVIRPTYSTTANRVTQWEAGMTLFRF